MLCKLLEGTHFVISLVCSKRFSPQTKRLQQSFPFKSRPFMAESQSLGSKFWSWLGTQKSSAPSTRRATAAHLWKTQNFEVPKRKIYGLMVQNFRVNTSWDVLEVYDILVGGFNPCEQKCSSDWIISPNSDENYKQNKNHHLVFTTIYHINRLDGYLKHQQYVPRFGDWSMITRRIPVKPGTSPTCFC